VTSEEVLSRTRKTKNGTYIDLEELLENKYILYYDKEYIGSNVVKVMSKDRSEGLCLGFNNRPTI